MPKTNNSSKSHSSNLILIIAIILLALNLRPILATIGPILPSVQTDALMSSTEASLLTSLPIFVMGICALAGGYLQKFMSTKGITYGILIISIASGLRLWFHDASGLIITSILAGFGIALIQVLLPSLIKDKFPTRVGLLMGIYTSAIMGGAALAASISAPLADNIGWSKMLAACALPAIIATALWLFASKTTHVYMGTSFKLPLHSGRAWLYMLFFGIGTSAYTLVLAWLPPFYIQLGWSPTQSGFMLAGLTITEVVAGLVISVLISRFPDRRLLLFPVLFLVLLGLIFLIIAPTNLALIATLLLGLGIGSLFPMSLIVAMDDAKGPAEAGSLLSFVQGGGYIIASLMPLIAGMIRDRLNSLTEAWCIMAIGMVILGVIAYRFNPKINDMH